jgi:hypothetical protein
MQVTGGPAAQQRIVTTGQDCRQIPGFDAGGAMSRAVHTPMHGQEAALSHAAS